MPEGLRAGYRIHWREAGEGARRALLIHCSLAHSGAWSAVIAGLEDRLVMTAFDMPGHGKSEDWRGGPDYQGEVAAIAATFCNGPTDLIGHSFGGTVALRLAVERPDLVQSLTLIEPVAFTIARRSAEYDALQKALAPFRAGLAAGDAEAAARAFNAVWGGTTWEALAPAQREAMAARIDFIAAGNSALEDDIGGVLAPGRLEALTCPVLLIEGAASPPVIGAIHARLAGRLGGASGRVRRVSVPEAGHMAPVTHPEPIVAAIGAFLG